MKLLKSLRVILAVLSFAAICLVFVDFTGMAANYFSWLPKLQLVPALLAANVVALGVLAAITLVVGRVYCSVLCPLGIY
ncbi:MAG: 4Fe-4S binding protein, partial [Muribaculaceae bacterium]|nr:4Fe-4S binding protein [Muribaculaceae bacterium]